MCMSLSHCPSVPLCSPKYAGAEAHAVGAMHPESAGEGDSCTLRYLTCAREPGRQAEWQGGVTCIFQHRDYEHYAYSSGFAVAMMP